MKRTGAIGGLLCVLAVVSGCGTSQEKIHGAWKVEETGSVWEFGPDGKLMSSTMVDGQIVVTKEGMTWSISGDILTVTRGDKSGKARIKELTDGRLVLKDDDHAKEIRFNKSK